MRNKSQEVKMKIFNKRVLQRVLLSVSSLMLLAATTSIKAETGHEHHHGHSENADTGLVLNNGKKWKTDAPLRLGMQKINDVVMSAANAYHHDTLTQEEANKVSQEIKKQISYLIKNCKLVPEADATLHVLIGDFLGAAEKIQTDPLSSEGMPEAVQALIAYPTYFEHDRWGKITQ